MPFFDLTGTSVRQEVRAGCATFATMAYIVVVNPQILGDAGMPREGVMVATCLAAALGSCLMGLLANYPFALAPGMGLNAFFAYGGLFLAVIFLAPLAASVPAVATAPVLVLVGALMMEPIRRIDFADPLLAIPAFLTAALTPLAFSIAEGVSAGVLSYTLLNLLGGRPDRVGWPLRLLAAALAARYFFL